MRAKVVHQVHVTSVLHEGPSFSEGLLGDLVQLFSAQQQVVALVSTHYLLENVLVIWRVPMGLGTVDETFNLIEGRKGRVGYMNRSTSHLHK